MTDALEDAIRKVGIQDLREIARATLAEPKALVLDQFSVEPVGAVHNDARTIGIARIIGTAVVNQNERQWSCVAKVVDSSISANAAAAWNDPLNEERVYEAELFLHNETPFRPARCFLISRLASGLKVYWLEDLTDAPQPPWTLGQYLSAANHIGIFNGALAQNPRTLAFEIPQDVHRARRTSSNHLHDLSSFRENYSDPLIKTALGDVPPEAVIDLAELWGQLHEITPLLPHALAFGDCHARNLFPFEKETVAVDWAGLSQEPVGADISVLIGSGVSWSIEEAEMVVSAEQAIFDSYVDGVRSTGFEIKKRDLRLAFFTHFPMYLNFSALVPEWIRSGRVEKRREFMEARFGAKLEELPERMRAITIFIPKYVAELRQLLGETT